MSRNRQQPALPTRAVGEAEHTLLSRRLQSLREIASVVNSGDDLQQILNQITFAVCRHGSWSMSGIMCADRGSGWSMRVARHDPYLADHTGAPADRWVLAASPVLKVVTERRPVVIEDAQSNTEWPGYRDDAIARGYHTAVIMPLEVEDAGERPMALSVLSREVVRVTDEELNFLQTVAHQAALAVRSARRLDREQASTTRLRATFQVHAELMRDVLANAPMDTVYARIEAMLPQPVVILDATANLIRGARSPAPEQVADEDFARLLGMHGAGFLLELVRRAAGRRDSTPQDIDLAPLGLPLRTRALVEALMVDDQLVGGLLVFAGTGGFDELDRLAVNEAKFALSMHMMRSYVRFRSESELRTDLLARLFSGDWRHEAEVTTRAGYLGINLSRPSRLLVLALGESATATSTATTARGDGAGAHDRAWLQRSLTRAAERQWPDAKVVEDGEEWVLVVPMAREPGSARDADERSRAERFRTDATALLGSEAVLAVSAECRRPDSYPSARRACARIVSLARALGRRGLLAEDDFGPYALLLGAAGDDTVRRFVTAAVSPLADYDSRHGTDLLATLARYLRLGARPKACADALGIHVSTLRYRLDRIRDLIDIDLDDADQRFGLEMAVRLYELLRRED